jgi:transposase
MAILPAHDDRAESHEHDTWYGSMLVEIDPHHTSQTCSVCSAGVAREPSAIPVPGGWSDNADVNADVNAARVILARRIRSGFRSRPADYSVSSRLSGKGARIARPGEQWDSSAI